MKYLFIITGPSGCGKTTLLRKLEDDNRWIKATKLSTRLPRAGEHDAAGYSDVTTPLIESDYTAQQINAAKDQMRERITAECNVIYYMNNELYGFSTEDIKEKLKTSHVAIILSDLGVIKTLKSDPTLKGRIITLYISSSVTKDQLTEVWISRYKDFRGRKRNDKEHATIEEKDVPAIIEELEKCIKELSKEKNRLADTEEAYDNRFFHYYQLLRKVQANFEKLMPDSESYQVRVDRIQNFYYKYIIDIGLFDYVILNYYDARIDDPKNERMSTQACSIIDYLEHETADEQVQRQTRPKDAVFFVCAAPKSGKNILMTNLHVMSGKHIQIVPKQSLRERKLKDGQDQMTPIIEWHQNIETEAAFKVRAKEISSFLEADAAWYEDIENRRQQIIAKRDAEIKKDPENSDYHNQLAENKLLALYKEQAEYEEKMASDPIHGAARFFDQNYRGWIWKFHGKYYGVDCSMIDSYDADTRQREGKPVIPIIMISNMYQLDQARKLYGRRLVPIFLTYVNSDKGNEEYHLHPDRIAAGVYKNAQDAEATVQEIKDIKEEYFKNIGKFRHVLLNSGVAEDLHDQIINIVRLYQGN